MGNESQEVVEKKELVGAKFDFHLKKGQVIVGINHVGSDGFAKLEAGIEAKKFYSKAIDQIEELIPGDQKSIATSLKLLIDNLNF